MKILISLIKCYSYKFLYKSYFREPYAFQYDSTGLVHSNTRYIPYAFSYGKSYLIVYPGSTPFRYSLNINPQVCAIAKNIACCSLANTSSTSIKTGFIYIWKCSLAVPIIKLNILILFNFIRCYVPHSL